jgi:hypothetical protein
MTQVTEGTYVWHKVISELAKHPKSIASAGGAGVSGGFRNREGPQGLQQRMSEKDILFVVGV